MNESCTDCVNCIKETDCNEYQSFSWLQCEIYTEDTKVPHSKVPAKCKRRGEFKRTADLIGEDKKDVRTGI